MPSLKPKAAWLYSQAWHEVKQTPRNTVNARPRNSPLRSPSSRQWCAHVTVVPDSNNINVLRNGNSNGSKGWMVLGGHTPPIAALGNSEEEKNAQKKAEKNITSEAINSAIP